MTAPIEPIRVPLVPHPPPGRAVAPRREEPQDDRRREQDGEPAREEQDGEDGGLHVDLLA